MRLSAIATAICGIASFIYIAIAPSAAKAQTQACSGSYFVLHRDAYDKSGCVPVSDVSAPCAPETADNWICDPRTEGLHDRRVLLPPESELS
jgi:hypothetical protein